MTGDHESQSRSSSDNMDISGSLIDHSAAPVQRTTVHYFSNGQLEMLHYKDITWNGDDGLIITDPQLMFINKTTQIYRVGGIVHRLILQCGGRVDVMVCDTKVCTDCSPPDSTTVPTISSGQPRVHSANIVFHSERFVFLGLRASTRSLHSGNSIRMVQFQGLYDNVICEARVCNVADCLECKGPTGTGSTSMHSSASANMPQVPREVDMAQTIPATIESSSKVVNDRDELPSVPQATVFPSNGMTTTTTSDQASGLKPRRKVVLPWNHNSNDTTNSDRPSGSRPRRLPVLGITPYNFGPTLWQSDPPSPLSSFRQAEAAKLLCCEGCVDMDEETRRRQPPGPCIGQKRKAA